MIGLVEKLYSHLHGMKIAVGAQPEIDEFEGILEEIKDAFGDKADLRPGKIRHYTQANLVVAGELARQIEVMSFDEPDKSTMLKYLGAIDSVKSGLEALSRANAYRYGVEPALSSETGYPFEGAL